MTAALAALTGVLVAVLLGVERRPGPARGWVKAAASTAFLATAVAAGAADSGYGRWVLAGLALSWIGDVALVSPARTWFLVGLSAFLMAHAAYTVGFFVRGVEAPVPAIAAAALAVPAAVVVRWLWPTVPHPLRGPVAAYILVISVMVAAAIGTSAALASVTIVIAAGAFYLSDLAVARDRFVAPGFANRLWGLPLYYLAQVLFALST